MATLIFIFMLVLLIFKNAKIRQLKEEIDELEKDVSFLKGKLEGVENGKN